MAPVRRVIVAMVLGTVILGLSGCVGSEREKGETDTRPMTQQNSDPSPGGGSEKAPSLACGSTLPKADPAEEGPFSLVLSRTEVRAGEEITITIYGQQTVNIFKGVDSYLECWDGKGWVTRYLLVTAYSNGEPSVHPYPSDVAIPSLGLPGPGPERIRLPGDLKSGWYRIRKTFGLMDGKPYVPHTVYARLRVVL